MLVSEDGSSSLRWCPSGALQEGSDSSVHVSQRLGGLLEASIAEVFIHAPFRDVPMNNILKSQACTAQAISNPSAV